MKAIIPHILIYLALSLVAVADEAKLAELKTLDGKTYTQVTIRKVEPDGLAILHESGTAKVPFEKLSPEIQKQYGYDPAAALEHRAATREAQIKADAEAVALEAAASKAVAAKARTDRENEADQEFRDKVNALAKKMRVSGFQISDVGVIGTIHVMKPVTKEVPGSMIEKKTEWVRDAKFDGVMTGAEGVKAQNTRVVRPNGEPTTYETDIAWEGKAWRIGYVRYKTQQGLLRTCPLFTGSEKEAVKFYQANGLTLDAQKAIQVVD